MSLGLLLILSGCQQSRYQELTGETMGTHYTVLYELPEGMQIGMLKDDINTRLDAYESYLSNWREESWISEFNRMGPKEQKSVPRFIVPLLMQNFYLVQQTGGALDPTVSPLVDLWGFGPDGKGPESPSEQAISERLERCGMQYLVFDVSSRNLSKTRAGLELNLSATAKGYAVDHIGDLLELAGCSNYLVDIGGEVRVKGVNAKGKPWRIGITSPVANLKDAPKVAQIEMTAGAVATSGIYQNFRKSGQQRVSHIIDPRTGHPVQHATESVSIRAPTCVWADGLATACLVLTPAEALELVESQDDVEALILIRAEDGSLVQRRSSGWPE
ncbi:MAG: FAD:protein FMN transferase [Verrucomicrobiota bacterium]